MFYQATVTVGLTISLLYRTSLCESTLTGTITGYGSASNDPKGSNSVCCGLNGAEHSATYDDPGTCASDNSKYPVNTKIYIPGLQKYFIVQDSCADCVNQDVHFDLWMGPDSYTNYQNLLTCAESGGSGDGTIILNPNPGYTVDSTPLMDSSGKCDSNVDYSRTSPAGGNSPAPASKSNLLVSSVAATTMTTSKSASAAGSTGVNTGQTRISNDGSCDWAGHCKGASCQTYNDCGDPFSCIGGVCT